MQLNRTFALLGCALLVSSLAATAQSEAAVQQWLKKTADHYQQGPYEVSYLLTMNMNQQGMAIQMNGTGKLTFKSPKAMKLAMDIAMSMGEGGQTMNMSSLIVSTEDTIWTQSSNPMTGGTQVVKMTHDQAAAMSARQGLVAGMDPTKLDPSNQFEMMSERADLRVTSEEGGEVVLEGPVTEKFRQELGEAAAQLNVDTVKIILEKDSGALKEFVMGSGETPFMKTTFEGLKFLGEGELPADAFDYTPPEDAMVQDASVLLQGAAAAPSN